MYIEILFSSEKRSSKDDIKSHHLEKSPSQKQQEQKRKDILISVNLSMKLYCFNEEF